MLSVKQTDFGDSKYMRQVRQACMGRPFFHYIIITKYSACFYSQKDTFFAEDMKRMCDTWMTYKCAGIL